MSGTYLKKKGRGESDDTDKGRGADCSPTWMETQQLCIEKYTYLKGRGSREPTYYTYKEIVF